LDAVGTVKGFEPTPSDIVVSVLLDGRSAAEFFKSHHLDLLDG
jgi:hypothetical protein